MDHNKNVRTKLNEKGERRRKTFYSKMQGKKLNNSRISQEQQKLETSRCISNIEGYNPYSYDQPVFTGEKEIKTQMREKQQTLLPLYLTSNNE